METLKIQCIPDELGRLAPLPEYQTEGAAAMDLRAFLAEPLTLAPMERQSVPTGLAVELPQGFAGHHQPSKAQIGRASCRERVF